MFKLVLCDSTAKEFILDDKSIAIGAGDNCQITLEGGGVERPHAIFVLNEDCKKYRIENRSKSGTFINGNACDSTELKDGDKVRIGPHEFRYVTDAAEEKPASLETPKTKLVGNFSEMQGREFPINKDIFKIGREPGNDLVINKETVSSAHCEIRKEDKKYFIVDMGSSNGTFVDEKKVSREELKNGCVVKIDKFAFKFFDSAVHTVCRETIKATVQYQPAVSGAGAPTAELQVPKAFLKGENNEFKGKIFNIQAGGFKIGREADNDLVFSGGSETETISRKHCRIVTGEGKYWLIDESKHGTEVNGKKINSAKCELSNAAKIKIGKFSFVFNCEAKTAEFSSVSSGNSTMELQIGNVYLTGVSPNVAGQKFIVKSGRTVIGKSEQCGIVVRNDSAVSGDKCELVKEGGEYLIVDNCSKNGVFVNGKQVGQIQQDGRHIGREKLVNKCQLKIGETIFTFINEDSQAGTRTSIAAVNSSSGESFNYQLAFLAVTSVIVIILVLDYFGFFGRGSVIIDSIKPVAPIEQLTLNPRWPAKVSTDDKIISTPAIGDVNSDGVLDVIVASGDGRVYFLDGKEGKLISKFEEAKAPYLSSPTLVDLNGDGALECVIGNSNGKVYAIEAKGRKLWEATTKAPVNSSPLAVNIDGDEVMDIVVGCDDCNVYALNGKNGFTLWSTRELKGKIISSPAKCYSNRDNTPDIVFGTDEGMAYCVDGANGGKLWEYKMSGPIFSSPVVLDMNGDGIEDAVFIDKTGEFRALSVTDGRGSLSDRIGPVEISSPAASDFDGDGIKDIVVGTTDGKVIGINGKTGKKKWEFIVAGASFYSSPALFDANCDGVQDIVIGDNIGGGIYVINGKTWQEMAKYKCAAGVFASCAIGNIDNDQYFEIVSGTTGGEVIALFINTPASAKEIAWACYRGSAQHNAVK
jgi:pSer/pThr/pTyr-binding forkhead associated (FHA) protein/outer membrane protein assembly factor BamB